MSSLNVHCKAYCTDRHLTLERCSFQAMHDFQSDSPTGMSWRHINRATIRGNMPRYFSWTVQLKCLGTLPPTARGVPHPLRALCVTIGDVYCLESMFVYTSQYICGIEKRQWLFLCATSLYRILQGMVFWKQHLVMEAQSFSGVARHA
jgi:hypothetical protein